MAMSTKPFGRAWTLNQALLWIKTGDLEKVELAHPRAGGSGGEFFESYRQDFSSRERLCYALESGDIRMSADVGDGRPRDLERAELIDCEIWFDIENEIYPRIGVAKEGREPWSFPAWQRVSISSGDLQKVFRV